jgi:hypothetical protein
MLGRAALLGVLAVRVTHCAPCPDTHRVPVKLFNDAAVSKTVLNSAAGDAAWILKSACVEVAWIPCPPVSRSNLSPCAAPVGALELHVLSVPLTDDFHGDTLGVAMPHLDAGDRAAVFVSRVRATAARYPELAGVEDVMGCVMAHEIGHLLLHSNSHSSEGIMRADFRQKDLIKGVQRRLVFTPEELGHCLSAPTARVFSTGRARSRKTP